MALREELRAAVGDGLKVIVSPFPMGVERLNTPSDPDGVLVVWANDLDQDGVDELRDEVCNAMESSDEELRPLIVSNFDIRSCDLDLDELRRLRDTLDGHIRTIESKRSA